MLRYALFFFIVSLIAGLFGFTDIAAGTAEIARILFFLFVAVFVGVLILAFVTGKMIF